MPEPASVPNLAERIDTLLLEFQSVLPQYDGGTTDNSSKLLSLVEQLGPCVNNIRQVCQTAASKQGNGKSEGPSVQRLFILASKIWVSQLGSR